MIPKMSHFVATSVVAVCLDAAHALFVSRTRSHAACHVASSTDVGMYKSSKVEIPDDNSRGVEQAQNFRAMGSARLRLHAFQNFEASFLAVRGTLSL